MGMAERGAVRARWSGITASTTRSALGILAPSGHPPASLMGRPEGGIFPVGAIYVS